MLSMLIALDMAMFSVTSSAKRLAEPTSILAIHRGSEHP
jgi:hypothetical protein